MPTVLEVKEAYKHEFLGQRGIKGIGVGGHHRGQHTHIHIYVETNDIQVPREINGVRVIKRVCGRVRNFDAFTRPVPGGASVSTFSNLLGADITGTNGMAVVDSSGLLKLLSANHVYTGTSTVEHPTAQIGQPIWQPGDIFSGNQVQDTFAALADYGKISETGMNEVEWALATPTDPSQVSLEIAGIGTPTAMADPVVTANVMKSGAISGVTYGTIIDSDATMQLNYDGAFTTTFDHQFIVDNGNFSFSKPGDSGSIVVVKTGNQIVVVGMVVGGSSSVVVCNYISKIQAASGFMPLPFGTLTPSPGPSPLFFTFLTFVSAGTWFLTRDAIF